MAEEAERQPLIRSQSSGGTDGTLALTRTRSKSIEASAISSTWASEYKLVLGYSIPLVGTYLLQYAFHMVIVFVASRLSTEELAGVSLGSTTSNILGYAVFEGMATALDTLCSQSWGAGQPRMVGLHTLRYTVYIHLVAVPIALLWIFSPQVLRAILPEPALADQAGIFLRISVLGIPGYATFEAGKRYMQAQGNFNAGLVVLILCLPLSAAFNYLFVFYLEWRVAGAALAAALINAVRPFILVAYVLLFDRGSLQCWPAKVDRQVLTGWGPMIRLSIPGAFMTLSEWLSFEILTFATSYVSTVELAAQTFLSVTMTLLWHVPFPTSVAASTRIGHLMGAGLVDKAKQVALWHGWLFLVIGIINVGLSGGLLVAIAQNLITDDEVRTAVLGATVWVAFFCFFDSTSSWQHGIIRGLGWQSIGGWVTLGVNYLFALPLSFGLLFGPAQMGVNAIYLGLGCGLAAMTIIEALIVRVKPWTVNESVEEAVED